MRNTKHTLSTDLKERTLGLFFTLAISLKTWHNVGNLERELALYNELSKHFKRIYLFTYGDDEDLEFGKYLAENIIVVPKRYVFNDLWYSFLMPVIHRKTLLDVDFLKTNQMWGSWSAVLGKLIFGKRLLVRTGYVLRLSCGSHPERICKAARAVETISYWAADGIMTSSKRGYDFVNRHYRPRAIHLQVPNYIETDVFKPMNLDRIAGSICCVARLSPNKNLLALLRALSGLPYTLTLIGSGELEQQLKKFASENALNVDFRARISNRELPRVLNQHEAFILPSLWEGNPKVLLEAMSCGLPVIGTNVEGTNEIIETGKNGILCDTDAESIRTAIVDLMEDAGLRVTLGRHARDVVLEKNSLDAVLRQELKMYDHFNS